MSPPSCASNTTRATQHYIEFSRKDDGLVLVPGPPMHKVLEVTLPYPCGYLKPEGPESWAQRDCLLSCTLLVLPSPGLGFGSETFVRFKTLWIHTWIPQTQRYLCAGSGGEKVIRCVSWERKYFPKAEIRASPTFRGDYTLSLKMSPEGFEIKP